MAGYGAYPLRSAWSGVTSGYFARQVLNFSDLNDAEEVWESDWFFGTLVVYTLDAEVGTYGITGEPAIFNQIEGIYISEGATASDSSVTNSKTINASVSDGALAADIPGRTWSPINSPQSTLWTLIETP